MKLELHRGPATKMLFIVDKSMRADTRNTVALRTSQTCQSDDELTKLFYESNKTLKPTMTEFMTAIKDSKLEPKAKHQFKVGKCEPVRADLFHKLLAQQYGKDLVNHHTGETVESEEENKPVFFNQVGGTHYGEGTDVFDFSLEREHDCLQHAAIKYIDRHKLKNGEEDIRKAISVLERILQEQYSD